jgi:hypothetical protein
MSGQSSINSLAWRLYASLQPRSPIEQAADLAASGVDESDDDHRNRVRQRTARTLRRCRNGTKPRASTMATIAIDIHAGFIKLLKSPGLPADECLALAQKRASVIGPFNALAIQLSIGENPDDWLRLSRNLDETANKLADLESRDQLTAAKLLFLNSIEEEEYLCWPESSYDDPISSPQTRITMASSWIEFNTQLALYGVNAFLSWIGKLDVDLTSHWFSDVKSFPMFLPLFAGATNPADSENPIKNLIKLLENIQMIENGKSLPQQTSDMWWTRSRLGQQDLLSIRQFHELLLQCGADRRSESAPFSGCGLQLLTAANAFSILVLRDRKIAQNIGRRKKPTRMHSSDEFRRRYLFWWHRHRKSAEARGAATGTRPWPDWFSQSVCDAELAGL